MVGKQSKNTKSDIFFALNKFYNSIPKIKAVDESEYGKVNLLHELHSSLKTFIKAGEYTDSEEYKLMMNYKIEGYSTSDIQKKLGIQNSSTIRLRITRLTKKLYNMLFFSDDFPSELYDFKQLTINDIQHYIKLVNVAAVAYEFEKESNPYFNQQLRIKLKDTDKKTSLGTILTDSNLAEIVTTLAVYSDTTVGKALDKFDPQDLRYVVESLKSKHKNDSNVLYNAILSSGIDITPQVSKDLANYLHDLGKNVIYTPPTKEFIEKVEPEQLQPEPEPVKEELTSDSLGIVSELQKTIEDQNIEIKNLKNQLDSVKLQQASLLSTKEKLEYKVESLNNEIKLGIDKSLDYEYIQSQLGSSFTKLLLEAINKNNNPTRYTTKSEETKEVEKVIFFLASFSSSVFESKLKTLNTRVLKSVVNNLNKQAEATLIGFNIAQKDISEGGTKEAPIEIKEHIREALKNREE